MGRKPIGVFVEGGKTYTVSGNHILGIVMFDQNGKELEKKLFKKKLNEQSFTVSEECVAVRFLTGDYDTRSRESPSLKGNDLKRFLDKYNHNNQSVKERIETYKRQQSDTYTQ